MELTAHRGFTARQPEMTRAAYAEAIAWAEATGVELGLECDVHFCADDELICLHDLRVDRTSNGRGAAYRRSLARLRRLDFSHRRVRDPGPDQRALVTLAELLAMIAAARDRGVPVTAVIETKHPSPRGQEIEARVAEQLRAYGWHRTGSPVRVISFSLEAVHRLRDVLPDIPRTFLIEKTLGPWVDGDLPADVDTVGVDLRLLRADPAYAQRLLRHGHQLHVWTVNRAEDGLFCRDLGATSLTTDAPDVVHAALTGTGLP